jgi:hypothetical protein
MKGQKVNAGKPARKWDSTVTPAACTTTDMDSDQDERIARILCNYNHRSVARLRMVLESRRIVLFIVIAL